MSINVLNTIIALPTQSYQQGSTPPMGGDKIGGALVSELSARYAALCKLGGLYFIDSDSVILAAANTTKGAAGTIKLINGFVNPQGSGVDAHILMVKTVTVSGTPAGPLFYNAQTLPSGVSLSNAATGAIRSAYINTVAGAVTPSNFSPEVNVVLTRSDSATTAFTQIGPHGGPAAVAVGAGLYDDQDEVAGKIIIPPGTVFGLAATGAGTSHVVQTTIYFAVLPV